MRTQKRLKPFRQNMADTIKLHNQIEIFYARNCYSNANVSTEQKNIITLNNQNDCRLRSFDLEYYFLIASLPFRIGKISI